MARDQRIGQHEAHPVEAHQAGRGSQPQIPVGALQDLIDGLAGQPVLRGPRVMAVLADVLARIQRQSVDRRIEQQQRERTGVQVFQGHRSCRKRSGIRIIDGTKSAR